MTDRGSSALRQTANSFTVGPSSLHWNGQELIIDIDEITVPHLSRLKGQVRVAPHAVTDIEVPLAEDGRHSWRPFAPCSRISVDLNQPGWTWDGHGYLDANFGLSALEDDFSYWTWGRFPIGDTTVCFYDANKRDGSDDLAVAIGFDQSGGIFELEAPPKTKFRRSNWMVRRETRADAGFKPKQVKSMLDAPFYSRSVVRTKIDGHISEGVHEALDLDRFGSKLIKPMLACKVPRRKNWVFPD